MVTAYKVILLIIIVISFMFTIGEQKDLDLRNHTTAICIAGMISFLVSVKFL